MSRMRLPVLMYHGLHADARAHGRFDPVYSVAPDVFARQLDWLLRNGYRTLRIDELRALETVPSGGKHVLISFDDGDASNAEVALPLLRERGMTATFFITSDFVGQPGMLDAAGVRALADAGMDIGAHGRSHALLEDLDDATLDAELRDSRAVLVSLCGQPVDALALPGGRGGARERGAALALGYRHLFGSVPGPNPRPRAGRWLQRLAIKRTTTPEQFAALVAWRGPYPRMMRLRHSALAWPKRVLGNAGYERLRERLL